MTSGDRCPHCRTGRLRIDSTHKRPSAGVAVSYLVCPECDRRAGKIVRSLDDVRTRLLPQYGAVDAGRLPADSIITRPTKQEIKKMAGQLLDDVSVREYLGVTEAELQDLDDRGRLPTPIYAGCRRVWPKPRIDQWLQEGCPISDDEKFMARLREDRSELSRRFPPSERVEA